MKTRVRLVVSIIGLLVGGAPVFAQSQSDEVNQEDLNTILYNYLGDITQQGNTKIDLLINRQETSGKRRGIITHFCDTFFNTRDDEKESLLYFDYAGFRYDPRQSLFMYTLCTNVDSERYEDVFEFTYPDERVSFNLTDYISDEFAHNDVWEIPPQSQLASEAVSHACNPKEEMQACQFSSFLPDIFKNVLNDISNLKLATIYGYKYGNKLEDRKKAIEAFSTSYFGDADDPMVPCRAGDVHYLNPETVEGDKKHCSHPKTYKFVDETIKSAGRLVRDTMILDGPKVLESECEASKGDLFACALNNHGRFFGESDWHVFQNLYMNEWMFYSLFSEYYMAQIRNNPKYNPITFGNVSASAERNAQEIETLRYELQLSQEALNQMVRMLEQLTVAYPVHVGLMAYMEDLINYRKEIAKVYTPLHQLYYTLRNTQSCQG